MIKNIFSYILSKKAFNPHQLKLMDYDRKLFTIINDKKVLISLNYSDNTWSIQLLICETHSDYEEYYYVDHIILNKKPNLFKILKKGNYLITKNHKKI